MNNQKKANQFAILFTLSLVYTIFLVIVGSDKWDNGIVLMFLSGLGIDIFSN